MEGKRIIDNRYIIDQRLGSGGEGVSYLVRDKDSKDDELKYAAKILEFDGHEDEEEVEEDENIKIRIKKSIEIFSKICTMNPPHPNVIKCIRQGKGRITKNGKIKIRNYFIFEYAPKGDLWKMTCLAGGFGERYAKPIFQKILLGVQALHKLGVYHLDLKVDNIVLDKDYNPKICDFGFSTMERGILNYSVGTINYKPPQMFEIPIKYTGEKADIFSLGCVLFALVVGHPWFISAKKDDDCYRYIYNNEGIEKFFDVLNAKNTDVELLTPEFKNLYVKMIAYKEEDRPSIEEILNDKWFDEIKGLNTEAKEELLNEVYLECSKKEESANDIYEENRDILVQNENFVSSDTRGEDDDIRIVTFENNLIPKYKNIEFVKDNDYLKIKGKLNHYYFMNKLLDNIRNEFGENNVEIITNSYKYKCDIKFLENNNKKEDKEEDDDDEENEEENKQQNDSNENKCSIQIKLYQIGEEEFCLRLLRKLGSLSQYYSKVKKIFELSRKLL